MSKQDYALIDLIETQTRATIKSTSFAKFMVGVHNALTHGEVFDNTYLENDVLLKIYVHIDAIINIAKENEL